MDTKTNFLTQELTEGLVEHQRLLLAYIALFVSTTVALLATPGGISPLASFVQVAIVGIGAAVALRVINPDGRSFRLTR